MVKDILWIGIEFLRLRAEILESEYFSQYSDYNVGLMVKESFFAAWAKIF